MTATARDWEELLRGHRGTYGERMMAAYDELDRRLVAAGFPPTSPWWRDRIAEHYAGGRQVMVARVGRRGGKSSTVSRVAVLEALHGEHRIPPGDLGVVAVVSTRRDEAANRLRTIRAILDALGIEHRPCDGGLELVDRPVAFKVYAASIAGVSGFTAIFILLDEVAKWRDAETGANPATEVIASVRPTMATQPRASMWLVSSPMGTFDAHYDAFERGTTAEQLTAHAPSWVANPTLTEEQTRRLEPSSLVWAREYAAVPQAEVESSLLSAELLSRSLLPELHGPEPGHVYIATTDPATRSNAWTFCITTRTHGDVRRVVLAREWRGTKDRPLDPDEVARDQAGLMARFGCRVVIGDQWAADALAASYRRAGVGYHSEPWTPALRAEAYEGLAALLASDRLRVPPDDLVRSDLLGLLRVLTRNGETYLLQERNGRHSDYAPAIAMGALRATVAPREVPREQDPIKRAAFERVRERKKREERMGLLLGRR